MRWLSSYRMGRSAAAASTFIVSFCGALVLAAGQQLTRSPAKTLLDQAVRHADWFNWADAASKFQKAESLFRDQHDERNELYAKVGVLRATMEDHSLLDVRNKLAEITQMQAVQSDPELLLFASIAKADVDGELNAQDARTDWQAIERLANAQNNQKWANRAGRIVILINEHTHSAAEMVAAFAKENNLATLVGTTTAGEVMGGANFQVSGGYQLRIPITTWQTWRGEEIEKVGVVADHLVTYIPRCSDVKRDDQMDAAIKFLEA